MKAANRCLLLLLPSPKLGAYNTGGNGYIQAFCSLRSYGIVGNV